MKRTALLVGVPLVLAALWWTSESSSRHSAEVRITADHPTELRSAVIAAVVGLGGVRVEEDTSYDGRGSSQLVFEVPTLRLEDAIRSLDGLGGTVTEQRVDLSAAADGAKSVASSLDDVEACIGRLSAGDATSASCREAVSSARSRLDRAAVDVERSRLAVDIEPAGVSNPALIVAIALLCSAAIGLGVLLWRSSRRAGDIDLRELGDYPADDDLHLRRN